MEFAHTPILLNEVVEYLNIDPDGIYVDGTLGGGGHSSAVCSHLSGVGRLIGIDQDEDAIAAATARLMPFHDKVTIVRDNYCNMAHVLQNLQIEKVDGILLDLGVSSYQLDNAERGFTYREDVPLDMRMDRRQTLTARTIVNEYTEEELYRILKEYGEEQFAGQIVRGIVRARDTKPIETTGELNEIIKAAIPAKFRRTGGHPSKQTYQALRIEVNRELDVLSDSIETMINLLKPGARMVVLTFHSLEDRIVKTAFRKSEHPCTCPPQFPVCTCGKRPYGRVITRKPVVPTPEEMEMNSRAQSTKMRVLEKL